MNSKLVNRYARMLLNLLIGSDQFSNIDLDEYTDIKWDLFLQLARKNVLLIRSYEGIRKIGISISCDDFVCAAKAEKNRINCTVELIGKISETCERSGIEYVFPKAFQHYPDMGHDVDLFVLDRTLKIDKIIAKTISASPGKGSIVNWIAGKTGYQVKGYQSPLEIHHGRMGHIGEHNTYPELIIRNRRKVTFEGISTFLPSFEDQLIVQVIQRIYGHLYIRLSDVVHTSKNIQGNTLDWGYIVKTSKQIGIFDGLICYLSYIGQIQDSFIKAPIFPRDLKMMVDLERWGKVRFKRWHYKFPNILIITRVYSRKLLSDVILRNWESVGRLCLLPPLTVIIGLRNLSSCGSRFFY